MSGEQSLAVAGGSPRLKAAALSALRVLRAMALFLLWAIAAACLYNFLDSLAFDVRRYTFNEICPADLRHPVAGLDEEFTPLNGLVDWCEAWWWHPFRLITRLIPGVAVPVLLYMMYRWLRLKGRGSAICAAVFVLLLVVVQYQFVNLRMSMSVQDQCRVGFEERITQEECRVILGSYGDQRLYYPSLTLISFVGLLVLGRGREPS